MFRKLFLIGSSAMVGIAIAMFAHAGWFLLTVEGGDWLMTTIGLVMVALTGLLVALSIAVATLR